ncbi:MAG TPA: Mur ligase family protein [Vicinamibacterales bacterium]|nr:Mur ligase family protein [Vicinamibacterales bacterium]
MRARQAIRLRDSSPAQIGYFLAKWLLLPLGRAWRRRLTRTLVIAVTGSGGKTTTKDLIAGTLRSRFEGTSTRGTCNRSKSMVRTLAVTRPWHRFAVFELAAFQPGSLDELLWTLEPDVGVVTAVGLEHYAKFRSIEAVAREKASLVRALPRHGLAVLNADDPVVRAMAAESPAPVVLVGLSADATLRAENVTSSWPDGLAFDVVADGRRTRVRTRLFGEHWTTAALAALAVARHAGLSLEEAAAALETVSPPQRRLSETRLASGITFLEDNWKAPLWSIDRALAVLKSARANRRVLVLGQLSDYPGQPRRVYPRVVQAALGAADLIVCVGQWSHHGTRVQAPAGVVHAFPTLHQAHEFLLRELRAGDLVLLKSNLTDHTERLALARMSEEFRCWRQGCGRNNHCSVCDLRAVPHKPPPGPS